MSLNPEINLDNLRSGVAAFRKNLFDSLPVGLIEVFLKPLPRLVVDIDGDKARFQYVLGSHAVDIDIAEISELKQGSLFLIDKLRAQGLSPKQLFVEIHLHNDHALSFETSLPGQAEEDLKQVLAYQLDRLTPFNSDQVYYDAIIQTRDEASGRLAIKLVILPKSEVEDLLAGIERQTETEVGRLALAASPGSFNLLNKKSPRRKPNRNVGLLAVLCCALLIAPVVPVLKARSIVVDQYEQLGSLKSRVRDLVVVRNDIQSSLAALSYVVGRRQQSPSAVELLEEISRLVPDNSYLRQMTISGDKLEILGEGNGVVELIEKLEKSQFLEDVKFSSALTHDARTGVDRFRIEAKLELEQ